MKQFFKSFGKAILYFLSYLLIQGLIGIVYGVYMVISILLQHGDSILQDADRFMELTMSAINTQTSLILLIANALTLLAVWLFFVIRKKKLLREIQLNPCSSKNLIASFFFSIGFAFVLSFLMNLIPFPEHLEESFAASEAPLFGGNLWISILAIVIVGPITEEVLFRGLIYTRLKAGMPVIAAALLASLLFGLAHGEVIWIIDTAIAGLAFIWLFEITHSLYAPIVMHITNNGLSLLTTILDIPDGVNLCITGVSVVVLVCSVLYLRRINAPNAGNSDPAPEIG